MKTILCGLAATAAMSSTVRAEPGDTFQLEGAAAAEVATPMSIQHVADLRFGRFASPTTASTLRVNVDGSINPSGDVASSTGMAQPPEGRGPAEFLIELDGNRSFTAYIPFGLTTSNGSSTMQVTNGNGRLVRVVFAGRFSVYRLDYAGTLQIGANQDPGYYSGDFNVTVVYR